MKRISRRLGDLEQKVEPEVQYVPMLTLSVRHPDGTIAPARDPREVLGLPPRRHTVRRLIFRP